MVFLSFLYTLSLVSLFQVILTCELITVEDYENYAKQRLPLDSLEYLQRGADKDFTTMRNSEAFTKIKIIPRYLIDVSNRTTNAEALGKTFKLPIGVAPSGLQKRWHPDGELATIRGKINDLLLLRPQHNVGTFKLFFLSLITLFMVMLIWVQRKNNNLMRIKYCFFYSPQDLCR